ncbi:hypothetical protein GPECTOR_9g545 [Gonium pectorale]|uniref:CobW/HypB/UreG nucleotide-binding domain-containing protein n=1 Tax=Gonium pectorale TaxID=33097 RepID=A0A150GRR1_GONPE|nr:hypothetical protein GPECTOR_9g545 [Gonium pectorale]|eukprot:KXZ52501.1 hypothetical protein GPECTOR_9g545 [Gonium pectorale]
MPLDATVQKLPVPVNIITGSLGVGKTTVVQHLLRHKPPNERWALLVNEFGALGIDAALVTASIGTSAAASSTPSTTPGSGAATVTGSSGGGGVVVRELAGGCLCCTLSGPLGVAIAQLVRQAKPDRLIIEPSGLGHPAGLLDVLYGEHLRSALQLRAVICLVDVRTAAALEGGCGEGSAGGSGGPQPAIPSETFQDQINVADVLVGHKADLATPEQQASFGAWAEQLYPPKLQCGPVFTLTASVPPAVSRNPYNQVTLASHGQIGLELLDLPRTPVFSRGTIRPARFPSAVADELQGENTDAGSQAGSPGAGQQRQRDDAVAGAGNGQWDGARQVSCGWLFSAEDVFDRNRLTGFLSVAMPRAARLKGVFRVGKAAYVTPRLTADQRVELQPISYRRESRLELIVALPPHRHAPPLGSAVDAGTVPTPANEAAGRLAAAVALADWEGVEAALLSALQ